MSVEAAGFNKWQGHLILRVAQTAVVDAKLTIAGVNQEVTVAGDVTPLVNTANQTIGSTSELGHPCSTCRPSAPIHDIRFEGIMTYNWTDDTHLKPHNPGPTKVFGPNFLALKTLPPEARAVISNAGADAPDNSTDPCAP